MTRRIGELTARRSVLARHLHEAAHRNSRARTPGSDTDGEDTGRHRTELPRTCPSPRTTERPRISRAVPCRTSNCSAPQAEPSPRAPWARAGRSSPAPLTGRPDTDLPEGWHTIPGARGCTSEACDFRDHHDDLRAAGVTHVFGLSSQETACREEVADRLRLPFRMLSDPDHRLAASPPRRHTRPADLRSRRGVPVPAHHPRRTRRRDRARPPSGLPAEHARAAGTRMAPGQPGAARYSP